MNKDMVTMPVSRYEEFRNKEIYLDILVDVLEEYGWYDKEEVELRYYNKYQEMKNEQSSTMDL